MGKLEASTANQSYKMCMLYQKQVTKVNFLFILSIPTIITEDSACLTVLS